MDETYYTHNQNEEYIQMLVGKSDGKSSRGTLKRTVDDNIKLYLKIYIRLCEIDWPVSGLGSDLRRGFQAGH
jgi:hypothetical protein